MKPFSKIYKEDLDIVGKKAVELSELSRLGIPIPNGFVVSTIFFKKFLDQTGISKKIKEIREISHPAISESIEKLFDPIKKQIMQTHIPKNLAIELHRFYKKHAGLFKNQSLNIFSSSKNNKSIIFKNVKGDANLVFKIKEIWASHINNPVAIVVQKNISSKNIEKIATNDPMINNQNLLELAKKIQNHFYFPQVVEYVIEKGIIYITSIKPLTPFIEKTKPLKSVLLKGIPLNPGIVTGIVRVLRNQDYYRVRSNEIAVIQQMNKLLYSKIAKAKAIVADRLISSNHDKFNYRQNIKIPTIIGVKNAIKILQNGKIITINGATGEIYSGGFL